MRHEEFDIRTGDGLKLYSQAWEPEGKTKAVVCLIHGLGEHSGRYAHLGNYLTGQHYALFSFDLRGHGKSEGQRGHAQSMKTFEEDISLLLSHAGQRHPGLPIFLYGHSLGGTLVLDYAYTTPIKLTGVIATGPLLRTGFEPPTWKIALGKAMRRVMPTFSMSNEIERPALSRDPRVVQAYISDPLVHDRISASLGIDMLQLGLSLLERASDFPLPLLLMHGSADRLASPQASREFAEKAGGKCTLKIWDGFYHEIHNEPEKDEVFKFLMDWMEKQLSS
jgi:acylglycerol lipase